MPDAKEIAAEIDALDGTDAGSKGDKYNGCPFYAHIPDAQLSRVAEILEGSDVVIRRFEPSHAKAGRDLYLGFDDEEASHA